MSDSNMNAKTEAAENKKVPVDENQRAAISPDTSKNDAIPENQRPIMPEEDKRRLRAMRGKCVPDVLRRFLGEATKDHEDTPSEKLVKAAKERDILFDMINNWKESLDELVGREGAGKNEDADFIREYIAALSAAKDVLTRRITALLAQS